MGNMSRASTPLFPLTLNSETIATVPTSLPGKGNYKVTSGVGSSSQSAAAGAENLDEEEKDTFKQNLSVLSNIESNEKSQLQQPSTDTRQALGDTFKCSSDNLKR